MAITGNEWAERYWEPQIEADIQANPEKYIGATGNLPSGKPFMDYARRARPDVFQDPKGMLGLSKEEYSRLIEEKNRIQAGGKSSFGGGYSEGAISKQRHTTVQPNESPFAGAFAGQQKPEATQAPSPQLNTMSPFMQSLMQNHPPEQQPIGGGQ